MTTTNTGPWEKLGADWVREPHPPASPDWRKGPPLDEGTYWLRMVDGTLSDARRGTYCQVVRVVRGYHDDLVEARSMQPIERFHQDSFEWYGPLVPPE